MSECHKKMCNKSIPDSVMDSLPDCQGGTGRHKCVICAYHEGVDVAKGLKEYGSGAETICSHDVSVPKEMLENLPASQGGKGRHKCANTAFMRGFKSI